MPRPVRLAVAVVMLAAVGCGQDDDVAAPAATTTTVVATTTVVSTTVLVTTTAVASSTVPPFPPAARVRHEDRVFGVFVAVERTQSAPELARAREELRKVGYAGSDGGDVNCDQGARETLGLAPDVPYFTVAVYFRTRQEAQQFVDAFRPGVVGTAEVTSYCRD